MSLDLKQLEEIRDLFVSVASDAGAMILSARPTMGGSGSKKNSVDLVTETDKAVEKMVSEKLLSAYPDFAFVGEETYTPGTRITEQPTFIVDPIDGTTNFIHGFPYVCISLGLAVGRVPTVGVVFNPFTGALYTAIRGQGAFLNGTTRLPLNPTPEPLAGLGSALVCVEWGSDRSGNDYRVKTETFKALCAAKEEGGAMVHSLRSLGSAALNLCAVAAGQLDLYWEGGCWAWDVCAGWTILSEAEGLMVDANPGGWETGLEERRYLAVRKGEGQRELIEEFWGCVAGKLEVGL
ncbi:inositol monophosphatase [Trichodelitschia bisporula]|uniref:Inositol-1-monophosphatase n=1 Tax=Trichodelitschia bisporula TaxID=703511 RepID=A0A6G1HK72_9PEZI|nr:inositol monophosphatase [Trichodelitschia bisporula]